MINTICVHCRYYVYTFSCTLCETGQKSSPNYLFLPLSKVRKNKLYIFLQYTNTLYCIKHKLNFYLGHFLHNLCSELTSMWTFKMNSRNTKTTNEPTATNNKSDRPHVNILDTWKTLKYLNINDSVHLKDLEISKYKRESKGRWPIKMCRFIFVNCCLIWLSKH